MVRATGVAHHRRPAGRGAGRRRPRAGRRPVGVGPVPGELDQALAHYEAFIRFARNVHRIEEPGRAPAYLRSIVLNLARDQNRRGLVSLRHRLPFHDIDRGIEDQIDVREDQREVLDALRELPTQQRACLVLRYYDELGPDEIAATLGISRNSVKTHLQRGLSALESRLTRQAAS